MEAKSEEKEDERAEGKEEKCGSAESKGGGESELLRTVATYFKDQAFGAGKEEGLEVVYEDFILQNAETFYGAEEEDADGSGHKIEYTELHQVYALLAAAAAAAAAAATAVVIFAAPATSSDTISVTCTHLH
jgi:hypothetical protein